MNCIKCNNDVLICLDSRKRRDHIRRRKECQKCGERFMTIEFPAEVLLKEIEEQIKESANRVSTAIGNKMDIFYEASKVDRKKNRC